MTAEPKPTRQKNPAYDVFAVVEATADADGKAPPPSLRPIAYGVYAPSKREAIVRAAAGLPEEERYGTFMVALTGQLTKHVRARKVATIDEWS